MTVGLVSAYAGDRELTEVEAHLVRTNMHNRGPVFYTDLLYAITHQYFAPEIAVTLWQQLLTHKLKISEQLGRNVRMTVATLDYLSNITDELKAPTLISEASVAEMANLSMRDGLTGLFNHLSWQELLELEFHSHLRYGVGVTLLLLDVDDFKAVNDSGGHREGNRVLVDVAKALLAVARDSDICCRVGGDEFSVILRLTSDLVEATDIANRIRQGVSRISTTGQRISVSIGVALCDQTTPSPQALIESADRALYTAKNNGKDRVCALPYRPDRSPVSLDSGQR